MEVMYSDKKYDLFDNKSITGIYKDKQDLIELGIDINGIIYDDEWTVKKFLNGRKIKTDEKISNMFNELGISTNLLRRKIKTLSKGQLKLVLFCYIMLNKKKIIILDYFDKGLSYINKKKIINYLKRRFEGTLVLISNDLVFLNSLCNKLIVFKDKKIVFNDRIEELYKTRIKLDYPEIIKFIKLANKNKAKLSFTVSTHELIKDIYRSVR